MIMTHLKTCIFALLAAVGINGGAVTLDEAKILLMDGDYAQALPVLRDAQAAKPRDAQLNMLLGQALLGLGRTDEAMTYLRTAQSRGAAEASLIMAEAQFMTYALDDAEENIAAYEKAMKRARRDVDDERLERLNDKIALARSMLDRVEKIAVVDSITVSRDDFFRTYRLSRESGSINGAEVLPKDMETADPPIVFMPESKQFRIWAAPDTAENYVLMSSSQLYDGTWEKPHILGDALENGGDSNFPFMMADGITLYYANNGEGTLGGYDIFISRREDQTDFLQPTNVGMPYNSPYDDYLLAIDELTGTGWWATDRNQIQDSVTIYMFVPSELRTNYPPDSPDLASRALLTDYRATQPEGADYTQLREAVASINRDATVKAPDFYFAMPGGRILTSWDEITTTRGRRAMEEYLDALDRLNADLDQLKRMRSTWSRSRSGDSSKILSLEAAVDNGRKQLRRLANEAIKANTTH